MPRLDGSPVETDGRKIWRRFAENYHLFRGTPTRLWMDYVLSDLFGIDEPLTAGNGRRRTTTRSPNGLPTDDFRPRALFERFNIEVIATTEGALDDLRWHKMIRDSGWKGRVVTAYRPDAVVDPDFEGFSDNLDRLGEITGCDTGTWKGYLDAHRARRAFFKSFGATSSDHGHPTAETANLSDAAAEELFDRIRARLGRRARAPAVPRPDADRDGEDEPRRRAGPADPSRLLAQPFARHDGADSAATRASISRPIPTTWPR